MKEEELSVNPQKFQELVTFPASAPAAQSAQRIFSPEVGFSWGAAPSVGARLTRH